jgi:CRP-like cAMP-binding protein
MATNTDAKLELLGRVPLFSDLGKKDLLALGQLAEEIDVAAGRELMRQGEHGRDFFVIVDGAVRIDKDGTAIRTLGRGDFFGEIALIDGGTRTATATTESPSKLLLVGHREFHSLMAMNAAVQNCVLMALARRVRNLDPVAD